MDWLRWILLLLGCALIAAIYLTGASGSLRRWPDIRALWRRRGESRAQPEEPPARSEPSLDDPDAPELHVDAGRPGSFEPELDVVEPWADAPVPEAGPEAASETAGAGGRPRRDDASAGEGPGPPGATQRGDTQGADTQTGDEAAAPELPDSPADEPAPAEPEAAPGRASRAAPQRGARQTGSRGDPGTAQGEEERLVILYLVAQRGERLVGARLAEAFARHGLRHGELGIFHASDSEGRTVFSIANLVEPGSFDLATMDTLSTPGVALFTRLPGPQTAQTAFDRMVATGRELAEELGAHLLDSDHSTLTRQTEQHLRDELREFDLRRGGARS